jgi:choline dehydrogenase-like flavoprotein
MSHLKSSYDIIVIGSGAAGSVMAYEQAKNGKSVLVLEKGKRNDSSTFEHDELQMYARLYKLGGLQTTTDNDTTIAQGETLGGSTVINNAIWLRANLDRVLPEWHAYGAQVPKAEIEESYAYLEEKLNVTKLDINVANKGTHHFLSACEKAGVKAKILDNNRKECIGCGWCNYGCKYDRKTSMLVTFIPWAEKLGVHFATEVKNAKVVHRDKVTKGVTFEIDSKSFSISAPKVIVSAGAIGSSAVLLNSKINPKGNVGTGLHLLGGFFVNAEMPEKVNGYEGIGLTCLADVGPDHVVETWFAPPGIFALTMAGWFRDHHERMLKYPFFLMAGVMVGSKPTGRIKLKKNGQVAINFKFDNDDLSRMRQGFKKLAMILFKGGAKRVMPSSFKDMEFKNIHDLVNVDRWIKKPEDLTLGSSHPQGGNRMSDDPKKGVVDSGFKVHGYEGVYVVDTSIFPSNLWVNCQATVMAVSKYASSII